MGAWGAKAFENDSALDFLGELEHRRTTLENTLTSAAGAGDDYLDVDDASAALAAGEIVAAAHGGSQDRLAKGARAWLSANGAAAAKVPRDLALRAVQRVFERSEVRELWDEGGPDSEWHKDVQELIRRLSPT